MVHIWSRLVVLLVFPCLGMILAVQLLVPLLPTEGLLLFGSNIQIYQHLYLHDVARGLTVRLSYEEMNYRYPSMSPTTGEIVFVSEKDEDNELYLMDFDGRNQRQLTHNSRNDNHASWSPNGGEIVYESNRDDNSDIYILNIETLESQRVTFSQLGASQKPRWSHDGTGVFYDSSGELYRFDLLTGETTQLTEDDFWDEFPYESPDGQWLAYASHRRRWRIHVMDSAGNLAFFTDPNERHDTEPAWSPDSTRVIFQSTRQFPSQIFMLNVVETDVRAGTLRILPIPSPSNPRRLFNPSIPYYDGWQELLSPVWIP